jgi:RNA polymerase sigma factor (sigma-70 family)
MTAPEAWAEYRRTRTDEARRTVAEHHLYLVRRAARHMTRRAGAWWRTLEFDDFVAWGTFGLLRAIGAYAPDRGDFADYARPAIYGAMRRGLRDDFDSTLPWYTPREVRRSIRSGEADHPRRLLRHDVARAWRGAAEVDSTDFVRHVVKGLTREEQANITLRYLCGCSQHETARAMGVSDVWALKEHRRLLVVLRARLTD